MQYLWTTVKTLAADVFGTRLCGSTNGTDAYPSSLAIVRQESQFCACGLMLALRPTAGLLVSRSQSTPSVRSGAGTGHRQYQRGCEPSLVLWPRIASVRECRRFAVDGLFHGIALATLQCAGGWVQPFWLLFRRTGQAGMSA